LLAQRYSRPSPALFLDRDGEIIKDRDHICESPDNRWIKLAELFPRDELEDGYAAQFCKVYRAPAKPFRMALRSLLHVAPRPCGSVGSPGIL
jgi:hypothetical protein